MRSEGDYSVGEKSQWAGGNMWTVEGRKFNGVGTYTYKNGDTYRVNGGCESAVRDDGVRKRELYTGKWQKGEPHGYGT